MKAAIQLLVIDPQNDFCDLPPDYLPLDPKQRGADGQALPTAPQLPVAGAHADMLRLAQLVERGRAGLSHITVTLDAHHRVGIERPALWRRGDGSAVAPFTQIKAADVRAGTYVPRDAAALPRVLAYLDALEAAGRYCLMVWTPHCEIGTWGQNVHADLRAAYNAWEEAQLGQVWKLSKGSNPWTEHYSALMAEVPDPTDPATQLNVPLVARLAAADLLLVGGQAGSHCVKATVEHLVDHLPAGKVANIVLLTDCMSPVPGFEAQQQGFLAQMAARGARLARSDEVLPELLANGRR